MEFKNLEPKELAKLKLLAKKNLRKAILHPAFFIIFILIFSSIPLKFLPKKISNRNAVTSPDFNEETIASFIGTQNFLIIFFILAALMIWASMSTYKPISIKKDLRDQRKKVMEGVVSLVDQYEGQPYVHLEKGTGIKILHFDPSNFIPLKVGDKVLFEVYEHSKILIQVLGKQAKVNPKIFKKDTAKVINVDFQCPACYHKLSKNDLQCPDCGLNFS